VLALVLGFALAAGLGWQTWQLRAVSSQLDRANQRLSELTQGQEYAGERLDAVEDRAAELERRAGEAFNSEEIAEAVVPSVFMVVAGDFTGTAFAVGPEADSGGTNLFTNYHVVQSVWDAGGREVMLERTNQRYEAEIVEVDPDVDVAWLRADTSFRGLSASSEQVRSGQPIIAVGAPLGLTDVVTTGVVSSPSQELPDGSGPWIQFDAAVNPGNSGGPVINSEQEVVGIATRKGTDAEALGFAVPIETACGLFDICD
jgi:S1-C subfamily serine protease